MAESLKTGLILMAAGMGTVYLLLAALVFIVQGVSKVSRRLDRAAPAAPAQTQPPPARPTADTELVTVISAAVAAYQRDTPRSR